MKKLFVFDPPLCCPTVVCGHRVDPKLSRFIAIRINPKDESRAFIHD